MTFIEDPALPPSLTDNITRTLRRDIVSGKFAPDSRLPPEEDFASTFKASLPTVRGALRRLVAEEMIYSRRGPGGGHFVSRPDVQSANRLVGGTVTWLVRSGRISQADILEIRQMIGAGGVRLAAQRRTERDVAKLEQAILKMSDSSLANDVFCAAEIQFSRLIASACGNALLALLNLIVTGAYASALRHKVFTFEERETIIRLSSDILVAIRSRQAAAAEEGLVAYIDFLRDVYFAEEQSTNGTDKMFARHNVGQP